MRAIKRRKICEEEHIVCEVITLLWFLSAMFSKRLIASICVVATIASEVIAASVGIQGLIVLLHKVLIEIERVYDRQYTMSKRCTHGQSVCG